jgi:hypothetical protein
MAAQSSVEVAAGRPLKTTTATLSAIEEKKSFANAASTEGRFLQAIELYNSCVKLLSELEPQNEKLISQILSNRPAAFMGMGNARRGAEDTRLAIKRWATNPKAHYRPACALRRMREEGVIDGDSDADEAKASICICIALQGAQAVAGENQVQQICEAMGVGDLSKVVAVKAGHIDSRFWGQVESGSTIVLLPGVHNMIPPIEGKRL